MSHKLLCKLCLHISNDNIGAFCKQCFRDTLANATRTTCDDSTHTSKGHVGRASRLPHTTA